MAPHKETRRLQTPARLHAAWCCTTCAASLLSGIILVLPGMQAPVGLSMLCSPCGCSICFLLLCLCLEASSKPDCWTACRALLWSLCSEHTAPAGAVLGHLATYQALAIAYAQMLTE